MKTPYNLIFLFLVGLSHTTYALQNDPNTVLGNEWFLQSLTINGEEMIPPSNEEVAFINLYFDIGDPEVELPFCITNVCDEFIVRCDVTSDAVFLFGEVNISSNINCELQENIDFQEIYFNFLASSTEFPYELIETDDVLQLTLTAPNGNQAIYGNSILSTEEVSPISFQVYPNPVRDFLYINAPAGEAIEKIRIYTASGKEVKRSAFQKTIDVKGLTKGLYFVVITSNKGSTAKKIIIE